MKITAIHTLWLEERSNLCWVQIETDTGWTGLGETYYGPEAVSGYIHQTVAPYLLGKNPLTIDRHSQALVDGMVGFNSISAEMRGASAVDLALWDIFGQATGQPIYQLLGGQTHERIKVYNTCAGYGYNKQPSNPEFNLHSKQNLEQVWGYGDEIGPYEDLEAFHHRPGQLAKSLLAEGITMMKIWPFDQFAEKYNGQWIDPVDLEKGAQIFRDIREAVGDQMEIALEMHAKWSLPAAKKIASVIDPYGPIWYEDPIKLDHMSALEEFSRSTKTALAASELLATRRQFLPLFETKAVDFVMVDLSWCGGITEGKKIATMAEAHHLPIMAHDCTGPISLTANVHFSVNVPNCFTTEFVRAYYSSWYKELVTDLPNIENGWIYPLEKPGLGTQLKPEVFQRSDIHKRSSTLKS